MSNKIEDLDIDFSFKKNNVDELFLTLVKTRKALKTKIFAIL